MVKINPYMIERIRGGTLEHDWMKHYQLRAGDIFVEVGAFWGRFAVLAERKGCSQIILVEPSPENITHIEVAVREVPLPHVTLVKKAVSDKKGTAYFIVYANPAGHRLAVTSEEFLDARVEVETDTMEGILDSLGIDHVDLLACDCENAEVSLTRGLGKWLSEKRVKHFALAAYHAVGNPETISKILIDAGYKNVNYEKSNFEGVAPFAERDAVFADYE